MLILYKVVYVKFRGLSEEKKTLNKNMRRFAGRCYDSTRLVYSAANFILLNNIENEFLFLYKF